MDKDEVRKLAERICRDQSLTLIKTCSSGAFKHTFQVQNGASHEALKLLVEDIDAARIQREIAASRACNHPNISRLLDAQEVAWAGRQIVYFREEFLDGGTLTERPGFGALSFEETKTLGLAMCRALEHLVSIGIVHRDIKPDNVMYRADGTAVLLDLGIARHLTATTLTQSWAAHGPGTPLYAAPEQLNNDIKLIDWRTDQFSLGVTLAFAALGRHPYSSYADFRDVITNVAGRQPLTDEFKKLADRAGLRPLARMVDPWPIRRFRKPQDLLKAWEALK